MCGPCSSATKLQPEKHALFMIVAICRQLYRRATRTDFEHFIEKLQREICCAVSFAISEMWTSDRASERQVFVLPADSRAGTLAHFAHPLNWLCSAICKWAVAGVASRCAFTTAGVWCIRRYEAIVQAHCTERMALSVDKFTMLALVGDSPIHRLNWINLFNGILISNLIELPKSNAHTTHWFITLVNSHSQTGSRPIYCKVVLCRAKRGQCRATRMFEHRSIASLWHYSDSIRNTSNNLIL